MASETAPHHKRVSTHTSLLPHVSEIGFLGTGELARTFEQVCAPMRRLSPVPHVREDERTEIYTAEKADHPCEVIEAVLAHLFTVQYSWEVPEKVQAGS